MEHNIRGPIPKGNLDERGGATIVVRDKGGVGQDGGISNASNCPVGGSRSSYSSYPRDYL